MGGYNDARQGAPYPPPQPFPNPHQQVYPPMQYGYPQPVRMFDQNGRPMYVAATVQPEMVQNVPYINFHPDYAHQQYGPPLPQPVMATKPREPIPPRERKPLVLVNPDSQEIVNLPSPPSRPLSKNPTPNTTHDSEVIVDKMRVREELHAMVKQVVTAPVAQSEPKPQPVKNTMPSAWDKPHDFSKVVEKHTPLGKKPVEQRIPAVELKKVIKEPTSVTEKKLTPKPVDPKKVVTEATAVVEKSVESEKVSIKSTPVVEKPVEPKKVAEKSVDSKKVVDMPTPVPEKPVDQEKKPEVTPEQEKSVDDVIKLEKAVEDAVEAPVEPSETPKEEAEAVTNTPSESTLAEGGPSLFEAPEGFGADDQANSQEDLTADEDDDCESVAEVDEEKLREEEETERLRLESIQKLKELELNLEELDKKMKAPQVYDRELMNCVRAIEELSPTNPPLTKEKIKDFGLDPGAKPEPQRFYDNRQIPKNPYNKIPPRNSQGGGFRQHSSSYQKRAPVMGRNSIERAPKVDLKNKAVNAWKAYKIKPEDMEKEEIRIEQVRSLLNKITPTNKEELIGDFLKLSVSGPSPAFDAPEEQLSRVISVMFDKAVEEPRFCSLYSEICKRQVEFELRVNRQSSRFRNSILSRAQGSFVNKTMDEEKEAFEQETDEEKKKILKAKYDEDFVKFRRRKFGNINFIGQLYHQQLLSSKIIQWCFYDLLRATYPDKETGVIPKPPYDEESLQCATHLLEVVGKNFEAAKDFNQAQDYLNQTVAHLMSISGNCSPKIKFKIIGVKELKDHKWKPRNVVEQGPKKISEIHQEIQKEQQQLNQARDAYERKQSNVGFRQNSTSIPRRDAPPPARGSQDARIGQIKRAQAAYSSIKAPLTAASPRNMSMAQTVVPRRKSAWASGASGGGSAADSPGSRTILQRGEKESALNNARNLAKDTPRSVKPPVLSPEEQEKLAAEKLEWEAKLKKLPQRIKSDLEEIEAGDLKVEELTEDLFKTPNNDKCLTDVFSCFAESCAQNISKEPTLVQAGHILRSWLKKPHYKQHIFRGIEDYCQKAVGESLSEDFPKLWTNLGLVIAKLLQYEEQAVQNENEDPAATTTSSTAVSLSDFGAIFKAGVDGSSQKRYALLVASLKHLVEQLPSGDEEQLLGLRFEFDTLCDKLKMDGLDGALQACNVDVVGYKNLFEALKSQ